MNKADDRNARAKWEIAVIGMSGRFPGAANIDEFWDNLKKGVEAIAFFSDEELKTRGIEPGLLKNSHYVKAKAFIKNIEYFDASFFGYTPDEAEIMNPQLRIFHECAWEALEDAGYDPESYDGLIGLYAGASSSFYWESLSLFSGKTSEFGYFAGMSLTDRDFLSTRLSYKLNLKGPSSFVQTACSTSLVSIHMACRAVLSGECHMALAGGISITEFQQQGYIYEPGMILSSDGHCRTFDKRAKGTLQGNGIGIVVLKRLKSAIEDKDHIYAVIKGSAINNDGSRKVGYTAPSVDGQAQAIRTALAMARAEPESITYLETHGTGTNLGDPVEIAALKLAFKTNKKGFCLIGSVKTNIGHLDAAAGVAGFIKTVLALKHRLIPPSLHFENPNPKIDFKNSPFYVNTKLREWENGNYPLRAGVSSFGIGGTNAHVILEQAPEMQDSQRSKPFQLLLISARTWTALEKASGNLAAYLKDNPDINLADAAYTLQVGRKSFNYRRMLVCSDINSAIPRLSSSDSGEPHSFLVEEETRPVVFMFPGQGAQYVNMGLGLYKNETVFRQEMDRCFDILKPLIGCDIKEVLYPHYDCRGGSPCPPKDCVEPPGQGNHRDPTTEPLQSDRINQTEISQPVLFVIEYALAKLLMKWGIRPDAMIGHSIGEYTAACLSGVFSLEDALKLVALRGQLMQTLPSGSMLSVSISQKELSPLLNDELSLAAVNSSLRCVVSGTHQAIDAFTKEVKEKGYECRRLHTSHAFHSNMMDPIVKTFEEKVSRVELKKPEIPYISNVSGTWVTLEETVNPGYWAAHLRETVRFGAGIEELCKSKREGMIFVEMGPGKTLSTLVRQNSDKETGQLVMNLLRHPREEELDHSYLLSRLGQLWLYGKTIDWQAYHWQENRYRLALPTYPFERRPYWIDLDLSKVSVENLRGLLKGAEKIGPGLESPGPPVKLGKSEIFTDEKGGMRPNLTTPYTAPRNEDEKKLTQIWQKFFGIQRVGIDDDFFELGGDSLKTSIIISRIHRELNVLIPLTEFFKKPTIRGLALHTKNTNKSIYSLIEPVERKEYYIMSPAQTRIYVLQQMDEQGIGYNITFLLILEGNIDKTRFGNTFRRLIKRHETLRTSFEIIEGKPVQRIHPEVKFEIQYYEKAVNGQWSLVIGERETPFSADSPFPESIVKAFIGPFDLSQAPLLRVGLIKGEEKTHILMIDMHHTISDGFSEAVLVKDLGSLYSEKELPQHRIQYKDFSEWQCIQEIRESIKQQEQYWLKEFSAETPLLDLPTDFTRPVIQSFEGKVVEFEINKDCMKTLKNYALEEGATIFMVLLTVFNIFLYKLSGQEEIVVGTPVAGRYHYDLENLVGMFVNTLVLRNFPTGEKNFKQLLKETKVRALEAFENQIYPFEELVEKVVVNRDAGRNPLFDIMFAMPNTETQQLDIPGLKLGRYNYPQSVSIFDISLQCAEIGEVLWGNLEYKTKLFKADTIERFINCFKKLISNITENPEKKISDLEIVTAEEKKQFLFDFNNTVVDYPREKTIYELFEGRVERTPDHTALIGHGEGVPQADDTISITYKELEEQSNQLAHLLQEKGVQPETIVGIMMERSIEMIIDILGILKAGGVYLPIDPEYPQDRLGYMLNDSSAKFLVTTPGFCEKYKKLSIVNSQLLMVNEKPPDRRRLNTPPKEANDNLQLERANLAYIIYTSGSSGRPKGVMVEHHNVVRLVKNSNFIDLNESQRLLMTGSIVFDITTFEIWGSLLNGLYLYVVDKDVVLDVEELKTVVIKNNISVLHLIPQLFKEVLEQCPETFAGLEYFLVGGDMVNPALINRLRKQFRHLKIIHCYGPTENTVFSTTFHVDKYFRERIPIGKAISNSSVYILDQHGHLQPVGVPGEFCAGGEGVARGYLNNPELTFERFINYKLQITNYKQIPNYNVQNYKPNGIHAIMQPCIHASMQYPSHSPIYRTGDLARWLTDGNIEFLGRIDSQVKIRGFRIELGEIENQLLAHETIKEAVVVAKTDEEGDKYLCAYFLSDIELTRSELRGFLSGKLPDYMVPAYFVPLEKIPLTPTGKVDRNALPDPGLPVEKEYIPPRNKLEKKLVEIWLDVLGIKRDIISIDANFFELGGHSLKATVMIAKIHQVLNIKIPLVEFFRNPSIKALSGYMREVKINKYVPIEPTEEKEYCALSSAQKRLYILQQMELQSTAYNLATVLSMVGEANTSELENAFRKLLQRHEILRTSFEMIEGEPVQRIHDQVEFEIEYYDLQVTGDAGPATGSSQTAAALISSFIGPFDLSKAPLLRVGLIKEKKPRHILMVDMHHIISDGVTIGVLIKDLALFYRRKELSPVRLQYKDFSQWQNSEWVRESIKKQEEYWLKEFVGEIPVLDLPADFTRPVIQGFAGSLINFKISNDDTGALKALALEVGATLFTVLLVLFNLFLSKISGREDIVVGTPIAGRRHSDLEDMVGMFINTLALRNFPVGEKNVNRFLKEVKMQTLQAFENQDYPYEELVEKASVNRDASRNPLFDIMFVLQNVENPEMQIPGLQLKPYNYQPDISKFDMTLQCIEIGGALQCTWEYSTKLFKADTIKKFINYFKKIISIVIENSTIKISAIQIISEEERNQILFNFNKTVIDYPKEKTFSELMEKQMVETPDHIALVFENHQLSYKVLSEEHNLMAWMLRTKGVGPDVIVGLMVDRSLEMLIGIIGILRAGGAYLPMDPQYPQERIAYMLADSKPKALVTTRPLIEESEKVRSWEGEKIFLDVGNRNSRSTDFADFNPSTLTSTCKISPVNLAYVIYTSGSTGKPKGVAIGQQNLINFINGVTTKIEFSTGKAILALTTVSFDIFVLETLLPLVKGLKVIIASERQQKDPQLLADKILRNNVNMLQVTPASLKLLIDSDVGLSCLENVEVLMVGGESFPQNLFERLKADYKGNIYNMYGPTETTVWSSLRNLTVSKKVDIGVPISNTWIYIVDGYDKLLPIGVTGELCIGGDGLARGYLNRPSLTAEKFKRPVNSHSLFGISNSLKTKNKLSKISNDQCPMTNDRFYRTGDLACWLPDGNIECLGRIDSQVKLRGFRIELKEIENQLLRHDEIKDISIVVKGDEKGDKFLCAYIVSKTKLNGSELRGFLSAQLPDYMVPAYFMFLEKIPLTPNGKIDRKALPEPETAIEKGYIAPRNKFEENLVEIWSDVLALEKEKISIDANFFQLGGHSLKATLMISKIHKVLNVKVPMTEIFKIPDIRRLSKYIAHWKHDQYGLYERYTSIELVEKKEYYVLSSAQKRLYILQQMDLESTAYNLPQVIFLDMNVEMDKEKLEQTVHQLIRRHESFRTSFELIDKEPVQRIHPEVDFRIEYFDFKLPNGPDEEIKHQVENMMVDFIRPFDLSRAPLVRLGQLEIQGWKSLLLVDMHHIISDGVSQEILVRDFNALIKGHPLPQLRLQYPDYAVWQNNEEVRKITKFHEKYWLTEFEGEIPLLNLVTDFPRPNELTFQGSRISFLINDALTDRLKTCAARLEVTLMMFLFSIYNILLTKYTSQEEILVGTVNAGRQHADIEHIIGFFVNMLPIKTSPHNDKTFYQYVQEVKEKSLRAYENQGYQFEELISALKIPRLPGRHPLVDTVFVFQQALGNSPRGEGQPEEMESDWSFELNEFIYNASRFDLMFAGTEIHDSIRINVDYATALFKKSTIQGLSRGYLDILEQVVNNDDMKLGEIEIRDDFIKENVDMLQHQELAFEF